MDETVNSDYRFREIQEDFEKRFLSEFACQSAHSRGRVIPEDPDPVRTCFQRDRDRILHSKAFRRLKHKTQVFIDPEEDHFRTRLTHTLEVAQIARTIAKGLRLNEDLTEAITLAHDLGHTPFGHGGEEALDQVIKEFDPTAHFRHYDQSLRIVDLLEKRGQGLNLTWEVRDGILGHSKGRKDLGITDVDNLPASSEGMCVRIADRIAYINHDIDDCIRAGILTLDDLPHDALEVLGRTHSKRIATMVINVLKSSIHQNQVKMTGDVVDATNALKDFMYSRVYTTDTRGNAEIRKAQFMLKELFRLYMNDDVAYEEVTAQQVSDIAPVGEHNKARRVTDYIAGMTDRYATMKFRQHFIPLAWSN